MRSATAMPFLVANSTHNGFYKGALIFFLHFHPNATSSPHLRGQTAAKSLVAAALDARIKASALAVEAVLAAEDTLYNRRSFVSLLFCVV